MLKLELILMSTLLLPMITKNYMTMSICILSVMALTSMPLLVNNMGYVMNTSWAATDLMSSSLIILSLWVTCMMILASTKIFHTKNNHSSFLLMTITLLVILVNCFSAPNIFMFYVWFEASLIPTMILIMCWGYQPERLQASMYLMIYTVAASLPMLIMLLKIFNSSKTALMPSFMSFTYPLDVSSMTLAWMLTIGGFMVKLPLFMMHLWLPKAHVEAPIAGSMILAAILLKLGGYGILRILSLFPHMSKMCSSPLMSIALVGAVSTSMICFRQSDLKSLIAYSSVGHMGLMVAGALMTSNWGFQAALAMMIAHGLSSSALFVMANINYELTHTRSLYLTKGLLVMLPALSMWWFLFTASNMAAPPSINLMSEIMLITSILAYCPTSLILLGLTSFFTAAYSLYMFTATHHGNMLTASNATPTMKSKDYTLMIMHMLPIIMIILKPELITSWA